jgi:hypothetical protein
MHSLAETADKRFLTFAPGFWPDVVPELWNDWKWQLKNRVTNLQQLEQKISLSPVTNLRWPSRPIFSISLILTIPIARFGAK